MNNTQGDSPTRIRQEIKQNETSFRRADRRRFKPPSDVWALFPESPKQHDTFVESLWRIEVARELRSELYRRAIRLQVRHPELPEVPPFTGDPTYDVSTALVNWCRRASKIWKGANNETPQPVGESKKEPRKPQHQTGNANRNITAAQEDAQDGADSGQRVSETASQMPNPAPVRQPKKHHKPGEACKRAEQKLMKALLKGALPETIRQAAKWIGEKLDTTRRAAHSNDQLQNHFNLRDPATPAVETGQPFDLLVSQADAKSQDDLQRLSPRERRKLNEKLRRMPVGSMLKLLRIMSKDPDAGRIGDVPLLEETDQDSLDD